MPVINLLPLTLASSSFHIYLFLLFTLSQPYMREPINLWWMQGLFLNVICPRELLVQI